MSSMRQAVLGFLAAILSSALILGGISMALLQDETEVALALPTITPLPQGPSIEITILPGEPTLLALSPTPTETFPPPVCQPPDGWIQRAVGPDETMRSLAEVFGLPVQELADANCLLPSSQLIGGMILSVPAPSPTPTPTPTPSATSLPTNAPRPTRTSLICGRPAGWRVYYVRHGDTLFSISQAFYTTVAALQNANCLRGILIHTGQLLYVPNVATRTPLPSFTLVPSLTHTPTETDLPPTLTPTRIPTTAVPPTTAPTTAVPTTAVPTTAVPTTSVPTTAVPTTAVPTTAVPTTAAPTTAVPPTAVPTTAVPPTLDPVTIEPTINASINLNSIFSTWKGGR